MIMRMVKLLRTMCDVQAVFFLVSGTHLAHKAVRRKRATEHYPHPRGALAFVSNWLQACKSSETHAGLGVHRVASHTPKNLRKTGVLVVGPENSTWAHGLPMIEGTQ